MKTPINFRKNSYTFIIQDKIIKKFISILLLSIAFAACTKPSNNATTDDEMPLPTTSGQNMLACKVDGKVHVYRGTPNMFHYVGVEYIGPTNIKQFNSLGIDIVGTDHERYNDEVSLFILYPNNNLYPQIGKKYTLTNTYVPASQYEWNYGIFYVDTSNSFVIFSRVDSLVASGFFEFHGVRKDSTKISLTEGIFDIARTK